MRYITEYKDELPVLDYEELVSYIMEKNQYPKTDIERILDLETEYMEKSELFRKKGHRLSEV